MNFIIGLIVCIVLTISGYLAYQKCSYKIDDIGFVVAVISGVLGILFLVIVLSVPWLQIADTEKYKQQYEWFEQHEPSAYEDFQLTKSKIELNKWLFSAKATITKFPGWHFYPDEVIELEPIK